MREIGGRIAVFFLASPVGRLDGFFSSIKETVSTSRRVVFGAGFAAASAGDAFAAGACDRTGFASGSAFLAGAFVLAGDDAADLWAEEALGAALLDAVLRAAVLLVVFIGIPVSKIFAHGQSVVKSKPY